MRGIVAAGVTAMAVGAAGVVPAATQDVLSPCPTGWSKTATSCGGGLVRIEKTFVVRAVEGTLADEISQTWPGGVQVVIELTEVGKVGQRRSANAEVPSGKFKVKGTPPGEYCFRVGVQPSGWSCVEGRIVVSEVAPVETRVEVAVPPGK